MSIFKALFGDSAPQNISDLLGVCQNKINAGSYVDAAKIAHAFIVKYRDNGDFTRQENARRQAFGYYMLCKSTMKQVETCKPEERYDLLVAFFAANRMARLAFREGIGYDAGQGLDSAKNHEDYMFAVDVRNLYQKLYDTYDHALLSRADVSANEQLSALG